jgi:hypothetical protein
MEALDELACAVTGTQFITLYVVQFVRRYMISMFSELN